MVRRFFMMVSISTAIVAMSATAEINENSVGIGDLKLGGYGFWQFGQIVSGVNKALSPKGDPFSKQWTNNALLGLRFEAQPHERLNLLFSPEFRIFYPFPESQNDEVTVRPQSVAYINDARGLFSFGDLQNPFMQVTLGMFSYKYNPEVRNLGEYLFRTGTYPTYIINDFDFAKARLLGLKVSSTAINNLRCDLMLTSEYQYYPLYDFTLSGIAGYKMLNALDIGAGFSFARIFPVSKDKTSPTYPMSHEKYRYNQYITTSGDTAFYSFQATKLMVRGSFDPKPFLPFADLLGPEDLKVYGELTAVGLGGPKAKNDSAAKQHAYFGDLNRRTPRMVGINVPTFKVFDVLSFEAEYFPSLIPNDYFMVQKMLSPAPYVDFTDYSVTYYQEQYKNSYWRWSVYGSRQIINGFSVTGQVAFDHSRMIWKDGSPYFNETLVNKGNWYWVLKTGFAF